MNKNKNVVEEKLRESSRAAELDDLLWRVAAWVIVSLIIIACGAFAMWLARAVAV